MHSGIQKQRGISLIGMLFFGGILVFLGIVGAQVFPTYIEYLAIAKAVNKVKDSGTPLEARRDFDKAGAIDDITSISGKDLVFTQEGNTTVISFAYTREIPLGGPAYLVMKYAGRSK